MFLRHGVISQKSELFIATAVGTSDSKYIFLIDSVTYEHKVMGTILADPYLVIFSAAQLIHLYVKIFYSVLCSHTLSSLLNLSLQDKIHFHTDHIFKTYMLMKPARLSQYMYSDWVTN
jgi:hypothetical protein